MAAANSTPTMSMPSDTEIVFDRVFQAPKKLVFEVLTRPEHLKHWWGPRDQTLPVCEMDVRPGGSYRFVARKEGRPDIPFIGTFKEVSPYDRLVFTQKVDIPGINHGEIVVTIVLTETAGKTRMHETLTFSSRGDRDGMVNNGMERGAMDSLERLDELLARLQ